MTGWRRRVWRDWFRRATGPFKEFGWAPGALYVLDRLLRAASPRMGLYVYEFMVQPIGGKPLLPASLSRNLSFEEIGRGHPDVARMPAREDIKAQRFDQGARCIGAYRRGELLGYSWHCTDRYEEDEVRCTYDLVDRQASIFDFDLFVLPQHRNGLGFLAVWQGVNEMLAPRGVRYTFSRVTRFNLASRRAHAHLGWKRVGVGVFLQAWRLECMLSSLAPYVGVTWGPRQRIKLRLRPDALTGKSSAAGKT
jgi:hypothetical protein